jgi:hypothetical protein
MNDGAHNRRSFRVLEPVYLRYRVISEQQFDEGIDRHRIQSGNSEGLRSRLVDLDARIDESLFLLKKHAEKIAGVLSLLNDKLDIVVSQLPSFQESQSTLSKQRPQTCELSAEGMVFGADNALAQDTKLVLQMLLESDSRYIETFCRVVRQTDPPGGYTDVHAVGIAVEFVGMQPSQKELLIQHLFSRESETLRMRRIKLDDAS